MFRTLKQELKDVGDFTEQDEEALQQKIYEAAETIYQHECVIIRKMFEKGKIEGITETQLEHFVQSRINLCLRELGYKNLFKVDYNPISEWFYKGVNGYQAQDFFNSQGNQYQRSWDSNGFVWQVGEVIDE